MRRLKSTVHVVNHKKEVQLIRKFFPQDNAERNVWIVGDSYIRRGEKRARETLGTNLGVPAQVKWFGKPGMCWDELIPLFYQHLEEQLSPDVLVIHCGGNDLGQVKSVQLVSAMKEDLQELHEQFPRMKILLSSINQRRHWRHAPPGKTDKARKFVNSVMSSFVLGVNGMIVNHPYIVFHNPGLFLRDNVHLTPTGNDLFLQSIAKSVRDLLLYS